MLLNEQKSYVSIFAYSWSLAGILAFLTWKMCRSINENVLLNYI